MSDPSKEPISGSRHRGVIALLFGVTLIEAVLAFLGGGALGVHALSAAGAVAFLAAGTLLGVAWAQARRAPVEGGAQEGLSRVERLRQVVAELPGLVSPGALRVGTCIVGAVAAVSAPSAVPTAPLSGLYVALGVGGALGAATLCLLTSRYFADIARDDIPEAPGLAAWGRVLAWTFVLAAAGVGCAAAGLGQVASVLGQAEVFLAAALIVDIAVDRSAPSDPPVWRSSVRIVHLFGSRLNPITSAFDIIEGSSGVDVRSSWALLVVRRAAEPLAVGVAVVAWLMSAFTVVGPSEQGLLERFGVADAGPPLSPGLHVHFPWPVDKVTRLPVLAARSVGIGHEGEESNGPENVLWAREHAANEYTLVLGDGRDLVTIDAAVHYRIRDAHAWAYSCQNPEDALRAVAYRAVMDATVDKTLADVLSENVAKLTTQLTHDVQASSDALGLGVEVLGFTVGGMHPPVKIATDYEAVVSAQIAEQTAIINANAYANEVIPGAESAVTLATNGAQADGAKLRQTAAGESLGFRTLEAAYKANPDEFRFRRRLETLESSVPGHSVTILDSRIERDGGELWLMQ